jgi:hypothetical protein
MEQITRELLNECFPSDATIKRNFCGEWVITTPNGCYVVITDDGVKPYCGDDAIYHGIALLSKRAWGRMTVWGEDAQVLSLMAHGELVGIPVIPIVKESGDGCLRFFVAAIVLGIVCVAVERFIGNWVISTVAALIPAWLLDHSLKKAMELRERQQGQKYRDTFPRERDRIAPIERARKRGYL